MKLAKFPPELSRADGGRSPRVIKSSRYLVAGTVAEGGPCSVLCSIQPFYVGAQATQDHSLFSESSRRVLLGNRVNRGPLRHTCAVWHFSHCREDS